MPDAGAPEIITFSGASARAGAAPSAAQHGRSNPLGLGAAEAAEEEIVWAVDAGGERRESDPERRRAAPGPRWIAGPARGGVVVAAGEDAAILVAEEG